MVNLFRAFLHVYLFYVHVGGFLPCQIDFKTLRAKPSMPWLIWSVVYAAFFIMGQLFLYIGMARQYWAELGGESFLKLQVLTTAISYCSVLVMTTSIVLHHGINYPRIMSLIERVLGMLRTVQKFQLDGTSCAQQLRRRLYRAFFLKAVFYEVLAFTLFIDRQNTTLETDYVNLGLKSNLWLINIMTTLFVGVFLVIIYIFKMLSLRVVALSEELGRAQTKKSRAWVDLSFRHCDNIDEIADLHLQLRKLAHEIQRFFQPLLLLTFIYQWCDFIIQAYLWYYTYTQEGSFRLLTLLHFLTALLVDLVDVSFICAVVHEAVTMAAETGLMLQRFNEFHMDERLVRAVGMSWSIV